MPWSSAYCLKWLFPAGCYLTQELVLKKSIEDLDGSRSIPNRNFDGRQLSEIECSVIAGLVSQFVEFWEIL
jgi:hypothetical protein